MICDGTPQYRLQVPRRPSRPPPPNAISCFNAPSTWSTDFCLGQSEVQTPPRPTIHVRSALPVGRPPPLPPPTLFVSNKIDTDVTLGYLLTCFASFHLSVFLLFFPAGIRDCSQQGPRSPLVSANLADCIEACKLNVGCNSLVVDVALNPSAGGARSYNCSQQSCTFR